MRLTHSKIDWPCGPNDTNRIDYLSPSEWRSGDSGQWTKDNCLERGSGKTKSVVVFGKVDGNITVKEQCDLKANAEIVGDIRAGTLSIEGGATFMGNSQVGKHAAAGNSPAKEANQKP